MLLIPIEIIETAADFVEHLSDGQRIGMMKEQRKLYPTFSDFVEHVLSKANTKEVRIEYEKFYLIVYLSYKFYELDFLNIINKNFKDSFLPVSKAVIGFKESGRTVEETHRGYLEYIQQPNLIAFIESKVFEVKNPPELSQHEDDMIASYIPLLMIVMIINDTIKKSFS